MMTERDYLSFISAIDDKIAEYETGLVELKARRETAINALVELRASRTPIIEA